MLFGTRGRENDKHVFEYTRKSPKWAGRFGEPFSEGQTRILVLFKRGCMLSVVIGLSCFGNVNHLYMYCCKQAVRVSKGYCCSSGFT